MLTANWSTFCLTGKATQSFVHFYPASPDISAPYVVRCKLEIFGTGLGESSVVLDGARLSQPDGVRLIDAFPALGEEEDRLAGLSVEIVSVQPRVNLGASACVVEIKNAERSIKFRPIGTGNESRNEGGLVVEDSFNTTSLVVVNAGKSAAKPRFDVLDCSQDGSPSSVELGEVGDIPGSSVRELSLDRVIARSAGTQECSWGALRSTVLFLERESVGPGACAYLLYRDARTGRPLSVMPV